MRILLIEDDPKIAEYIVRGLREAGFSVDHAADGRNGWLMASTEPYTLNIVDRMLPDMDGLAIVQALRAAGKRTPILFLSALGQVDDRVKGLRAGGDDYLTKPFAFSELLARVEALLRRGESHAETAVTLSCGDLEMDLIGRRVRRGGKTIALQPREFQLLEFFLRNRDRVVSRTMLLEGVWGYHFDPGTNVIDVHISRLRQKIDRDFSPPLLNTVRGAGYRLGMTE
jgi:two-component system, OmpR family, response regulator